MSKAFPVVLAALLAVALVAPASVGGLTPPEQPTVGQTPSEGIAPNTTRVLQLRAIDSSGFGAPAVVVLDATAIQEADLDTAYSLAAVREKLAAAPNATVRREIIRNYTERAATTVRALQAAERDARAAFVAGDITAVEYARRLAVVHARATELARFLGGPSTREPSLHSFASPYSSLQPRITYLREELQYLTGPIRAEMAAAVVGDRPPLRVFVAVSANGFELAYIRPDGVYVRTAYRADNVDDDPTSKQHSIETLLEYVDELYPWARGQNASGSLAATPVKPHGTIQTTITHPHGRIVAHIDETTQQVYYEVQYKRLAVLPVVYAATNTTNNVTVKVSETYPSGPLKVKVLNATGAGLRDVPVTVNETTHRTGPKGVAWFVSPAGTYNVTATYNETRIRLTVTAR